MSDGDDWKEIYISPECECYEERTWSSAEVRCAECPGTWGKYIREDLSAARIAELEAEVARLTAACKAWEEKYWEAQERHEDPSLSDREAMIIKDNEP